MTKRALVLRHKESGLFIACRFVAGLFTPFVSKACNARQFKSFDKAEKWLRENGSTYGIKYDDWYFDETLAK